MKPTGSVREGDDYIVSWDLLGLALHFTRVRETDSSIRALATPITIPDRKRLLAPMMVNLFTKADRDRMADAIRQRVDSEDNQETTKAKQQWRDHVEDGFAAMIDLYTTPTPAIDLSTMDEVPEEPDLVWPVLARNQVNVWLADQKSGKSYDSLLIAAAISAGRGDLLPAPFKCDLTKPTPVVYCDSETDAAVQRRRLCRVAAGLGLSQLPPVRYIHVEPPFVNKAAHIRSEIARLNAALFVLDSLTFASGGNLNDTEVSIPTMNAAGEMGANCTKLLIAHHGKAGRGEGAQPSVIGSAAFEFKARNLWLIKVESEEGLPYLTQAWKHRYASDSGLQHGFGLRLDFNLSNTAVTFSPISAGESDFIAKNAGTQKDRVLAAIVATDLMKADTKHISAATGLSEKAVTRAARELIEDGRLKLIEGGKGQGRVGIYGAVQAIRRNAQGNAHRSFQVGAEEGDLNSESANTQIPVPYIQKKDGYFAPEQANTQIPGGKCPQIPNGHLDEDSLWAGMPDFVER